MSEFVTKEVCNLNHKPVDRLMDEVKNINTKMDKMKETLDRLPADLAKEFDKRYASKLSEKISYGMVGIILTSVVVAVLALIFK